MTLKKLSALFLMGLMTVALFSGCADDKAGMVEPPGKNTAEAPPAPERAIEGTAFEFGSHKGKVYALKVPKNGNIELSNDLVFMQDAIYLHGDEEKGGKDSDYLLRIPLQKDALGAPEIVGSSKGYGNIASNGKVILCSSDEEATQGKLALWDGKNFTVTTGENKWTGKMTGIVGSDEFLNTAGFGDIRIAKLTSDKLEYKDLAKLPEDKGYTPIYADKKELYIAAASSDDENTLLVLDPTGKEIRRIAGWEEDKFGSWAVTQNYIVMFGKSEYDEKTDQEDVCNLRVFDRATGKEIGDATVSNFAPGVPCSVSGNTLVAYNGEDTFYIIDL